MGGSTSSGIGSSTDTHRRTSNSMPSTYQGGGSDAKTSDTQR
jgi:hypothetical protein